MKKTVAPKPVRGPVGFTVTDVLRDAEEVNEALAAFGPVYACLAGFRITHGVLELWITETGYRPWLARLHVVGCSFFSGSTRSGPATLSLARDENTPPDQLDLISSPSGLTAAGTRVFLERLKPRRT